MLTFDCAGHRCAVYRETAFIKDDPKPIKVTIEGIEYKVHVTRWLPVTPPRAMRIEKYEGDATEFYEAEVLSKLDTAPIPKPITDNNLFDTVDLPAKKLQVLNRGMTLAELRQNAGEDSFLEQNIVVRLNELFEFTYKGFAGHAHLLLTASTVAFGITDISYKVVGYIDAGEKYPDGAVILRVRFSIGEMLE